MNLFGKTAPPHRRSQRKKTWVETQAKTSEVQDIVSSLKKNNPVIQAALVKQVTGVDIQAGDIKTPTAEEKFENSVIDAAIKDFAKDDDAMAEAKAAIIDRISRGSGRRRNRRYDGEESDNFFPGYGMGYGPNDPVAMVNKVRN